MKKIFILFSILVLTSSIAFAAKYKVNSSGKVINKNTTYTQSPPVNIYSNYNAPVYVGSNAVNKTQVGTIELVMDYSGSMVSWIDTAKKTLVSVVNQIPATTQIGFRVFGHDNNGKNPPVVANLGEIKTITKKKRGCYSILTRKSFLGDTSSYCSATVQLSPITKSNGYNIISAMDSVKTGGSTPLVYGLDRVVNQDFKPLDKTSPKKIVLITDGGENCGGDPCAFAQNLMKKRKDVHIDVVLVSSSSKKLECLTKLTGGHFYATNNLSNFASTLTQSMTSQPQEAPKKQNYEFVND